MTMWDVMTWDALADARHTDAMTQWEEVLGEVTLQGDARGRLVDQAERRFGRRMIGGVDGDEWLEDLARAAGAAWVEWGDYVYRLAEAIKTTTPSAVSVTVQQTAGGTDASTGEDTGRSSATSSSVVSDGEVRTETETLPESVAATSTPYLSGRTRQNSDDDISKSEDSGETSHSSRSSTTYGRTDRTETVAGTVPEIIEAQAKAYRSAIDRYLDRLEPYFLGMW